MQGERDDIPGRVKAHVKKAMEPMRNCGTCVDRNMRLLLCEVPYEGSVLQFWQQNTKVSRRCSWRPLLLYR